MQKWLYIGMMWICGLCSALSAGQQTQSRFTILGLGDSITEGGDYFTCYLYPLWQRLFTAGYAFDFIGPRESACRIGSLRHAGFSGKPVEFLEQQIDSLYRCYPADFVLLHAGHNHTVEEQPIEGMLKAYQSIIRQILAINPKAHILLAQVIPSGKLPKYSYIPELNRQIGQLVRSLDHPQVHLVDQATGFDWQQMTVADRVHPNRAGGERMAEVWFQALQPLLLPSEQGAFQPEIIPYKGLERGDSLTLHLFRPTVSASAGLHPVILFFFGGGWQYGTPLQFYRECAYYASRGFVAVAVDYRIRYLHHTTPFESLADAQDAVRWIRKAASAFGIDPHRVVVAGGSAGGHLAASLGTIGTTDTTRADYCPDLMLLYYPVLDLGPEGYSHEQVKERWQEISPLWHVSRQTPETLLMVGLEDRIAPYRVAERFQQALQQKGVRCELQGFPGLGHPLFLYRQPLNETFYEVRRLTDQFLQSVQYLIP